MDFSSIEKLEEYLKKDSRLSTINPVRFINVESIEAWVQVKRMLNRFATVHIRMSRFCEGDDTTPNMVAFRSEVKKLTESALITPISELLRINNGIALKTYIDLLNLPYHNPDGKLRIYIPVYRMKDLLNTVAPDDPRKKDSILFLNTPREDDYSLTIIQKELNVDLDGHIIIGFKQYMEYWEDNPNQPIIMHTQNAIHYTDVVFADDVRVIITSYDLLKCHYGLPADIQEVFGTEEQWHYLAAEYKHTKDFDSTMCRLLSTNKYSIDLLIKWKNHDSMHRWLIWLWSKHTISSQSSYIYHVLKQTVVVDEFIDAIYCAIMDFIDSPSWEQLYKERYDYLQHLNNIPSSNFWSKLDALKGLDKIRCLTNLSDREKEEIITSLQEIDLRSSLNILEICYPELAYYLAPFNMDSSIDDYFDDYRFAKVSNEAHDDFIHDVYSIAEEQGIRVYKFSSRTQVVNELYDKNTVVLFVDSLGAEYIPLLEHLFDVRAQIAYCNLPSITGLNKDFLVDKENVTFYDLDEWKHAANKYPMSIVKELELVSSLKEKVNSLLVNYDKIIIVADHGSSRLAVLHKGKSFPAKEGCVKKYRYGRYCEDSQNEYSDYLGCWHRDDNWIFANYDRFSQQGAPTNEIHGGASLEEMLVPVILINRHKESKKVIEEAATKINLTLLTTEPRMTLNQTVQVKFKLDVLLENVIAVVNNERYSCILSDGIYTFEHPVDKQIEYTAIINCGKIRKEIKYKVKKGLSNNLDI